MSNDLTEMETFVAEWPDDLEGNRANFLHLVERLKSVPGVTLEFISRPGLTYSLRAAKPGSERPLFAMIDVIEDAPRWLSVCFFADLISDPEEKGDLVPDGLMGRDAHCFDITGGEDDLTRYVADRLTEAALRD